MPAEGGGDPEHSEHEVEPEGPGCEELAGAEAVSARESEHRRQHDVVEEDDRDRRTGACNRPAQLRAAGQHERRTWATAQPGEPVYCEVRRVEELDVRGIALLDPLRQVLQERQEHDELRRKEQRSAVTNTSAVWNDWFRPVRTTKSCAPAAASVRNVNAIQSAELTPPPFSAAATAAATAAPSTPNQSAAAPGASGSSLGRGRTWSAALTAARSCWPSLRWPS